MCLFTTTFNVLFGLMSVFNSIHAEPRIQPDSFANGWPTLYGSQSKEATGGITITNDLNKLTILLVIKKG